MWCWVTFVMLSFGCVNCNNLLESKVIITHSHNEYSLSKSGNKIIHQKVRRKVEGIALCELHPSSAGHNKNLFDMTLCCKTSLCIIMHQVLYYQKITKHLPVSEWKTPNTDQWACFAAKIILKLHITSYEIILNSQRETFPGRWARAAQLLSNVRHFLLLSLHSTLVNCPDVWYCAKA